MMQENLEPIYNRCTPVSSAMKVCHLKAIASRVDTIAGQINDTMECEQVLF